MDKSDRIVIVGAGVFGLSAAHCLAIAGYKNVTVLDRHVPPVPDGSSVDISRVIRFDYADETYLRIAHEAYLRWSTRPKYHDIFFPSSFILTTERGGSQALENAYIPKTTAALSKQDLAWVELKNAAEVKAAAPIISGRLAQSGVYGYCNHQAGWVDAQKAIAQLRDECIHHGVTFISGAGGTVTRLEKTPSGRILAANTLAGTSIAGDVFVLAAGAWSSSLISMYNSTLSTAQVVGYMSLTDKEMERYKTLPIYINFTKGWFNFPPHEKSKILKMAVHGWGYTRAPSQKEASLLCSGVSMPPLASTSERRNYVPTDGEQRLRQGLCEILPELAQRQFTKLALCWYTDTPSGDFIIDVHPDHENLFVAGGGSGHAFKFLPVLGEYIVQRMLHTLPQDLAAKWRFRTEYKDQKGVFEGDGSRGGPARRELVAEERAKL